MNLKLFTIILLIALVFATGYTFREEIGLASVWKATGLTSATVNTSPNDRYTENLVGHWTFDGSDSTFGSTAWYSSAYSYCRPITINNSSVATTTTGGFAIVATTTLTTLKATSSGGNVEFLDGRDIVFTNGTDCSDAGGTLLDFYHESYATTTGAIVSWIEVNDLNSSSNTTFLMYYGNDTATDVSDEAGVWGALDEVAVWDLSEGPTGGAPQILDGTSNNHDGTTAGMIATDQQTGQLNGSIDFDGTDAQVDAGDMAPSNIRTWMFWVNSDDTSGTRTLVDKYLPGGDNREYRLYLQSGDVRLTVSNDGVLEETQSGTDFNLSADTWTHGVATFANGTFDVYKNGSVVSDDGNFGTHTTFFNATAGVSLGSNTAGGGRFLNGTLDDVRIYDRILDADDITTIYNNTNDNTSFLTFGAEESISPSTFTDISSQGNDGTGTSTVPVPGRRGQAIGLGGLDQYIDIGASYNGVKSIAFWMQASTSTLSQNILQLNGSANVSATNGTLSATGFTSPTIYVDGAVSSAIATSTWHHVVVTTGTGINASDMDLGRVSATYFGGDLDDVRIYSEVLTASEVSGLAGAGEATLNVTPKNRLTSGLVGHWTFDGPDMLENIADISGQGNDGGLQGQASTTTVPGMLGQALSFDGTDDYVRISADNAYKPVNISISTWIKSEPVGSVNAWENAISLPYRTSGWTDPFSSYTISRNDSNQYTEFNITEGGVIYNTQDTGGTEWATAGNSGDWFHAVLTYDGETMRGYINGVEANNNTTPSGDIDYTGGTTDLVFGQRSPYSTGEFLEGRLDEIRIYNRALSANEVLELYNMGR